MPNKPQIGFANGLAVHGANVGAVTEIEVTAVAGTGKLMITGVVDEEEIAVPGRTIRRKSMAKSSLENVLTVLSNRFAVELHKYDIHVNFPGGGPIDGPSAGVTMAVAIYSAIHGIPIDNTVAMTGEITIHGLIKPVGGVSAKIYAAEQAGAKRVLIPKENCQELYGNLPIEVIGIETIEEALQYTLVKAEEAIHIDFTKSKPEVLAAASI